jgi:hypothetical protein
MATHPIQLDDDVHKMLMRQAHRKETTMRDLLHRILRANLLPSKNRLETTGDKH